MNDILTENPRKTRQTRTTNLINTTMKIKRGNNENHNRNKKYKQ